MLYKEFLHGNTIDILSSSTLPDYELFFGPIEQGQKPYITDKSNLGEILADLGLIESKSWARKNNRVVIVDGKKSTTPWWGPLDKGFSMIEFGKTKIQLFFFVEYKPGEATDEHLRTRGE